MAVKVKRKSVEISYLKTRRQIEKSQPVDEKMAKNGEVFQKGSGRREWGRNS